MPRASCTPIHEQKSAAKNKIRVTFYCNAASAFFAVCAASPSGASFR